MSRIQRGIIKTQGGTLNTDPYASRTEEEAQELFLKEQKERNKQAKGNLYEEFLVVEVENLAMKGLTVAEIAKSIGVSTKTLYNWFKTKPDYLHAIKKARGLADIQVENALFKSAVGYEFTEVEHERRRLEGGGYGLIETKRTVKDVQPSVGAMVFYLKNNMPEKYKDKVEANVTVTNLDAVTFQLKRRSDEDDE